MSESTEKFECEEFAQYILERKRKGVPVYKREIRRILGMPEGPYYDTHYAYLSEYPTECALHYIATCRLNGKTVNAHRLKVWAL